jgi:molecular chaperone DnaJ
MHVYDIMWYQILKINKNADTETIRKSYYELASKCHPDRQPPDISVTVKKKLENNFLDLFQAYRILSDKKKKKEYDKGE